jgi:hypothetical protein
MPLPDPGHLGYFFDLVDRERIHFTGILIGLLGDTRVNAFDFNTG